MRALYIFVFLFVSLAVQAVQIDPRDIKPGTVSVDEFAALNGIRTNIQQQIDQIDVGSGITSVQWTEGPTNNAYVNGTNLVIEFSTNVGASAFNVVWDEGVSNNVAFIGTNLFVMFKTNYSAAAVVDASAVTYSNSAYAALTNVELALNQLLYVAPDITSLTGGSSVEIGATVANVTLTWVLNKTMLTRTLSAPVPVEDRDRGAGGSAAYTHAAANLTNNTTYTLTVGDGSGSDAASTSVLFYNRKYYGFLDAESDISDADIRTLANQPLTTTRVVSRVVLTPTGTQYIWVCYPATFGAAAFRLNDNTVTGWLMTTGAFVNASGYTNTFYKYRSPFAYSVAIPLEVQ
jgi:hypothetical protein